MIVHFRETPYGLAMSLVQTRRENGKVRHEHVASLGSIETPPSVAAPIEFWRELDERLAQLSNRLDAETRGKVMGAVHARVPMVTPDEQRDAAAPPPASRPLFAPPSPPPCPLPGNPDIEPTSPNDEFWPRNRHGPHRSPAPQRAPDLIPANPLCCHFG